MGSIFLCCICTKAILVPIANDQQCMSEKFARSHQANCPKKLCQVWAQPVVLWWPWVASWPCAIRVGPFGQGGSRKGTEGMQKTTCSISLLGDNIWLYHWEPKLYTLDTFFRYLPYQLAQDLFINSMLLTWKDYDCPVRGQWSSEVAITCHDRAPVILHCHSR